MVGNGVASTLDRTDVFPTVPTLCDMALANVEETNPAFLTRVFDIDGCALCEIGCCIQRLEILDNGAALILHGVLGDA